MMRDAWESIALSHVLTERRETPTEDELLSGQTPIIAKIGFNDGRIELRTDGQTKTGMIRVQPGDLVVSGINAAKGAIAIHDNLNRGPVAATIHYSAYIPNAERVDVRFLWWLLRSDVFRDILTKHVPGGIKTELKPKRFLNVPLPLPPLAEQQRIVARIEALAARIEEAKGLRAQAMGEVEMVFRESLSRVLEHEPRGFLADVLSDEPRNGWSARCDNASDGKPVLTLSAVTGFFYRSNAYKTTSASTDPGGHYWLSEGDILITRSNTPELVGHVAIYDGKPHPCIYPDLIMRMRVNAKKAERRFVWYWLRSPKVREYIRTSAKGTSPTMKKISKGVVMRIPYPTQLAIDDQRRIVAYLDDLQAKVEAVKRLQAETQTELAALLPAVLARAFRGEL